MCTVTKKKDELSNGYIRTVEKINYSISGLHKLQYIFVARIQTVKENIQQITYNAFHCKYK